MKIQTFIKKAVEGGWERYPSDYGLNEHYVVMPDFLCEMVLDVAAWKAVGEIEEWKNEFFETKEAVFKGRYPGWFVRMHRMIDALANGKTITDFLETL